MDATFFAWADEARFLPAGLRRRLPEGALGEHTWVTTYAPVSACPPNAEDGDYWYCRGECHTTPPANSAARLLRSGPGDIEFARLIGRPNDRLESVGLTYGRDGVCHQMANRILYVTGGDHRDPLTVEGVKGYNLSVTLYGVYGGKRNRRVRQEWERRTQEWKRRTRDQPDDG